jgi:hypothetical protein
MLPANIPYVSLRDPHRAAAALQPVVEQDTGDLTALARAGAVSQKPATSELYGIIRILARRADEVISLVNGPRSREEWVLARKLETFSRATCSCSAVRFTSRP